MKFAEENPQHALQLLQCKLDEGRIMAVHKMMTKTRPKKPLLQLCQCEPCVEERQRANVVAQKKEKEDRLQQQLQQLRKQHA